MHLRILLDGHIGFCDIGVQGIEKELAESLGDSLIDLLLGV